MCGGFGVWSLFCGEVFSVLSSFEIVLPACVCWEIYEFWGHQILSFLFDDVYKSVQIILSSHISIILKW